jgi:hypothetical protein
MKINIWIRIESVDDLAQFISDDFNWDKTMSIDIWYSCPIQVASENNTFIEVSITYDQYKKLEDL